MNEMTSEADVRVEIRGESVSLLPERAAFWHREETLLIADPHWGKAATFRAGGIPVPSGTTADAIARLDSTVKRTAPRRIAFLGDLLHARAGRSTGMFDALGEWRDMNRSIEIVLVRGNHDRGAGDPPAELRFDCVDAPYAAPPFVLAHHPVTDPSGYVIAGHVHPGIRLYGSARQRERLSCFVIGPSMAILPAFGPFTGLADVDPAEGTRIYAVAEDRVLLAIS
jgi:uncharacterized protein